MKEETIIEVLKFIRDRCNKYFYCGDCPCDEWLCDGEVWVCCLSDVAIKSIANKLTRGVNDEG